MPELTFSRESLSVVGRCSAGTIRIEYILKEYIGKTTIGVSKKLNGEKERQMAFVAPNFFIYRRDWICTISPGKRNSKAKNTKAEISIITS